MAKVKKFPKGFMWGTAMSAIQSEGAGVTRMGGTAYHLTYDARPDEFFGQTAPTMGVDSQRHFKEDLALMAKFGHNSFRNSFSWARLFPDGKNVDPKAVAYYHDFLSEAKKNGLKRVMALQHFDLPEFLAKGKGFLDPKYPVLFAEYANFIFSEFGSDVEIFATYNEPNAQLLRSYLVGGLWPFVSDIKQFVRAAVALNYSHALAVNLFKERFASRTKAKISFVHASIPVIPKDGKSFSAADKRAADDLHAALNLLFLDPMLKGGFGSEIKDLCKHYGFALLVDPGVAKEIARAKLDIVGMNYYTPMRASAPRKKPENAMSAISQPYKMPGARLNPFRGFEIWPEGIKVLAGWLRDRYANIPFWIGENGMPVQEEWRYMNKDGMVQDDYRISFVSEHLEKLWDAIQDGSKCVGYHMWSTYDCWSMLNGYKNTYGLFRVDLNTMKRFPKKSAYWFKTLAESNEVPSGYKKVEETIDLATVSAIAPSAEGLAKVRD